MLIFIWIAHHFLFAEIYPVETACQGGYVFNVDVVEICKLLKGNKEDHKAQEDLTNNSSYVNVRRRLRLILLLCGFRELFHFLIWHSVTISYGDKVLMVEPILLITLPLPCYQIGKYLNIK